MTARATPTTFTVAADGSYAARMAPTRQQEGSAGWFAERWTLDGPEPYAVPLPCSEPEDAASPLLPLADGRVLVARRSAREYSLTLLYPTGPGTGELPLGTVESEALTLLPPPPCGRRAYALARTHDTGQETTAVWLVAGGTGRPEPVAAVPGRCSGGAWLDREGQLLAVDRTDPASGVTKTVTVDLTRGGAVSPLLQITDDSNDRLLLADPESGLLLLRSDAPGEERLGWGVLGSHRPVRFPEALAPAGVRLTPFAVQPRQTLLPESCGVALCAERDGNSWPAVWHPALRTLRHVPAPAGWLTGGGLVSAAGELQLPYATGQTPCGLARLQLPDVLDTTGERDEGRRHAAAPQPAPSTPASSTPPTAGRPEAVSQPVSESGPPHPEHGSGSPPSTGAPPHATGDVTVVPPHVTAVLQPGSTGLGQETDPTTDPELLRRPVPLQQAPLTARAG